MYHRVLAHRLHENNLIRVARDSRIVGLGNKTHIIPEILFPGHLPSFFSHGFYLGLWVTQIATNGSFFLKFLAKSGRICFPQPSITLQTLFEPNPKLGTVTAHHHAVYQSMPR